MGLANNGRRKGNDMSNTREATCEERVSDQLAGRVRDLQGIRDRLDVALEVDDMYAHDAALDELNTFALCVDLRTTMVVQISTGGPGDQFEIAVERGEHGWELADNEATYRFLDWFDGATRTTDNEAVMAYLENIVGYLE